MDRHEMTRQSDFMASYWQWVDELKPARRKEFSRNFARPALALVRQHGIERSFSANVGSDDLWTTSHEGSLWSNPIELEQTADEEAGVLRVGLSGIYRSMLDNPRAARRLMRLKNIDVVAVEINDRTEVALHIDDYAEHGDAPGGSSLEVMGVEEAASTIQSVFARAEMARSRTR